MWIGKGGPSAARIKVSLPESPFARPPIWARGGQGPFVCQLATMPHIEDPQACYSLPLSMLYEPHEDSAVSVVLSTRLGTMLLASSLILQSTIHSLQPVVLLFNGAQACRRT